jgi:hypothetical protein
MILTPEKRGSRKPRGELLGDKDFKGVLSLLMRERGLKHKMRLIQPAISVAPHAGAWIETQVAYVEHLLTLVAPHAGAWIETGCAKYAAYPNWSLLT